MQPRQTGFTLIELIIAVAIVGILASFAVSTYQSSILKSRRADAKVTLTTLAQKQERYYTQEMNYADSLDDLIGESTLESDEGFYDITLSGSDTTFTLTATAKGTQADDTPCNTFTMTHTGLESSANTGGEDSTDTCW